MQKAEMKSWMSLQEVEFEEAKFPGPRYPSDGSKETRQETKGDNTKCKSINRYLMRVNGLWNLALPQNQFPRLHCW